MSIFRHIDDARIFTTPPKCARESCAASGTHWIVSDDDQAIMVYCEDHVGAILAEYHAAASAHPDDEELAALALWRSAPVTMAGGAA